MICFRLGIIDFGMLRVSVERHLDSAMRLSLGTFEDTIVMPHAYGHRVVSVFLLLREGLMADGNDLLDGSRFSCHQ
jgi:hypothetical protein